MILAKRYFFIFMLGLVSGAVVAHPEDQQLVDKAAIAEMLTQYSYRWDRKQSQSFTEIFTEDAVLARKFDGEADVTVPLLIGRNAILAYAIDAHQGRLADRQSRHHFSALVFLELTENTAITENMALITHQTSNDTPPEIRSSGIYRIQWRKTESGWLMHNRLLILDRAPD